MNVTREERQLLEMCVLLLSSLSLLGDQCVNTSEEEDKWHLRPTVLTSRALLNDGKQRVKG